MASREPCSTPTRSKFPRGPPSAPDGREFPFDLMLDVLLRVPAKDLCRLRAVCRAWRAATADALFVSAHAARHRDPLFLANLRGDDGHVQVMDLSGEVVKRIAVPERHRLLCTRLDLACVATGWNSCRVLNPATGAACALPESPAPEHADHENLRSPYTSYAFGRVPSTGEYKVLRIFNRPEFDNIEKEQLFEVFTVDADRSRWRAKQPRNVFVEAPSAVVVDGVVFFKIDGVYHSMLGGADPGIDQDSILSFDLETEEWRGELNGPMGDNFALENTDDFDDYRTFWVQMTLADLRGSLALVYYRDHLEVIDLWLLEDFEEGIWVKKYSIQTELRILSCGYPIKSLFALEDGRFVVHFERTGLLLIYDPRCNTSVQVEGKHLNAVAMYTGSLLCLQTGDMV